MAKQKNTEEKIVDKTRYVETKINDEMKKSFMAYAMAVNISRAIPDVRDGLKPVHRRILYGMHELGITSGTPYRKAARIVGDVMGKFHPHGDSSVYDALVRLAQDFSIREPLIDGQGNFGSVDGDPPAAMRYTEARMSKIAAEMLRDLDKETVDMQSNFDETLEEPTVLPARFPNLLVNGSDGIAVGMATNIPPHNLAETIDGVIALIEDPEITIEDLMKIIPAPDYPTGGIIMGRANVRAAYKTGHGGVVIRAKCEIEEYNSKGEAGGPLRQRIIVTELPYQVNKAVLIKTMADLVKDKRIEGISDIKEESDRKGMRIVIEVKRDAQAQVVLNMLYKHTNLQISTGITFLSLAEGQPRILNLKEMLTYYLEHQKEVITRRTKFDLEKAQAREHILEGLVKALANIDRVVKIIRGSVDKVAAAENLMSEFFLSDRQANAILDMPLHRLTSLEVEQLQNELAALREKIADLKDILSRSSRVLEIIKNELTDVKEKFGNPRRTELCIDYNEIDVADLIEREDVVISMTHYGYVKRLPVTEYKIQHRGGKGVTAHKPKEEDFVEKMFVTCTHDNLLFFTSKGRVYSIKAYEVPEAQKTARGRAIVNLLQLDEGEKITAVIPLTEEQTKGYLMMATRNGLIKKTSLDKFTSARKGGLDIRKSGKIAIELLDDDELISVQLTCGRDEILIASSSGKCIRFSEEDVRPMGRDTMGVRSMRLDEGEIIVDMTIVTSGCEVLTVSEFGYGKRSDIDEYRLQSRGGKGIKAGVFNENTGKLINLKLITPDDDIILIADNGTIIRMRAREVSKISRDTRGVRMMKVKGEGKVVCACRAEPYVEEEGEGEEVSE